MYLYNGYPLQYFQLQVILVTNSRPALNDVTKFEMQVIFQRIQKIDAEMEAFIKNETIVIAENGTGSPCISLSSVSFLIHKDRLLFP